MSINNTETIYEFQVNFKVSKLFTVTLESLKLTNVN